MDADRIADAFGLGRGARLSPEPAARGRQGAVWRLETDRGLFAVKVPFEPVGEDDVRGATAFHEAAYDAGVPTPRVYRTPAGEVFGDVGDTRARVYEWVDVLPPDTSLDPHLVGATVARVHRVPEPRRDHRPVAAWYAEPVGARRWDALVARLSAADAPFAAALAVLRDDLVALDAWVVPPRRVRTSHRDLWSDNLLPTRAGGVCVLDWENSGPADPWYELGCVLFEFGRGDAGRARALVEAYRASGGPGRVARRADFSMLIAQLGHIAEHAANAWLAATDPEARADAADWVAELVDDPHTPQVLDDLLAAVT
ncbi:MAG TPA: phosphotransferase [Nocardioides sp.]|nr:phosphotransferase [Nocardioides sp.]